MKHFDDQFKDFQVHWTSYLSSAGDGTGLTVSKFEIESLQNRLSLFEQKSDAKIAEIQEKYASGDEYELWNELESIESSLSELENIRKCLTHLRYSDEYKKISILILFQFVLLLSYLQVFYFSCHL